MPILTPPKYLIPALIRLFKVTAIPCTNQPFRNKLCRQRPLNPLSHLPKDLPADSPMKNTRIKLKLHWSPRKMCSMRPFLIFKGLKKLFFGLVSKFNLTSVKEDPPSEGSPETARSGRSRYSAAFVNDTSAPFLLKRWRPAVTITSQSYLTVLRLRQIFHTVNKIFLIFWRTLKLNI